MTLFINRFKGVTVGGLSKVTGTLGEGFASLSFDKKFENYRRNYYASNNKPTFLNNFRHNLIMV